MREKRRENRAANCVVAILVTPHTAFNLASKNGEKTLKKMSRPRESIEFGCIIVY